MKSSNLKSILIALGCLLTMCMASAKTYQLSSPNGGLTLTVEDNNKAINLTTTYKGQPLFAVNDLGLNIKGYDSKALRTIVSCKKSAVKQAAATSAFGKKYTQDAYSKMLLRLKGNLVLEIRLSDYAVAYRFVGSAKRDVEVEDERFCFQPLTSFTAHVQETGGFGTSYEERYLHMDAAEWMGKSKMATTPLLLSGKDGSNINVLIAETAVLDYPRMFYKGSNIGGKECITGTFPKAMLKWDDNGDRGLKIKQEADYIAKTSGNRAFPWRYFVVGDAKEILAQDEAQQLAEPSAIGAASWVRPGKVAWDWWNGNIPYGPDVKIQAGCNTDTYKYNIDFASKFGIEYILLDEGWAKNTTDPFTPNDDLNLKEVIDYGKSKGVGVFLWLTWQCVEHHPDLFKQFSDWGVAGVKIDFMDHSDQWMVNFYERMAKAAAEHHLMVDFHGSFTPSGLEYKYPNLLSYEGVLGLEQMGGCKPANILYLPFIRNAVGAMDFTPGAMINMQPDCYYSIRPNSASMGTRCFNLAQYVIFKSRLQMLADNPVQYYKNEECGRFIASVPVQWDETRVLDATVGKKMVIARRSGNRWFIGAMRDGENNIDHYTLDLSFLPAGKNYQMKLFYDGANASRQAMDYATKTITVNNSSKIDCPMVRNGGFAAVIE